jgi:hypothetical protein
MAGTITDPGGAPLAPENRAVSVGSEPRFIFAPTCTPRPRILTTIVPGGAGQLQVTLSAGFTPGAPNNRINRVHIGQASNALIDVPGGQSGIQGNVDLDLPGVPSTVFFVRRADPNTPSVTVPLVVTDDCGTWPTFVGGGSRAF